MLTSSRQTSVKGALFENLNLVLPAKPPGPRMECDSVLGFQPNKNEASQKCCSGGGPQRNRFVGRALVVTVLLFRIHKHQDQQTFKKEIWFHKYLLNSEFAFLSFSLFRKSY